MSNYVFFTFCQIVASIHMIYYLHKVGKTFQKYATLKNILWNKRSKISFYVTHYFVPISMLGANIFSANSMPNVWLLAGVFAVGIFAYTILILHNGYHNCLDKIQKMEKQQ